MNRNRKLKLSEFLLLVAPVAALAGFGLIRQHNDDAPVSAPTPKSCSLIYEKSKVRRMAFHVFVDATVKPSLRIVDSQNTKLKVIGTYLTDSKGKRYSTAAGVAPIFNAERQRYYLTWSLIEQELPKGKAKVWIKSNLLLDNGYKLPVSIRVR
jgi:hypothetical protein